MTSSIVVAIFFTKHGTVWWWFFKDCTVLIERRNKIERGCCIQRERRGRNNSNRRWRTSLLRLVHSNVRLPLLRTVHQNEARTKAGKSISRKTGTKMHGLSLPCHIRFCYDVVVVSRLFRIRDGETEITYLRYGFSGKNVLRVPQRG